MKRLYIPLISVTLSVIAISGLRGQESKKEEKTYSDSELYAMDLEKLVTVDIVSTSKMNLENESKAAGAVTVVTGEQIANSGAKNIEEVLRTSVGIDVMRASTSPVTTFGVRGLYSTEGTNNKILFLIDGHPFRSAFFGDATVFIGNISLSNISRIEIIRGPGSTLFGAGAFLGVINIVTREAERTVEASLSAGSFGTYQLSSLATVSAREKKFKATISANHFTTDGPQIALNSDRAKEEGSAAYSITPGNLNYARKTTQFNLNSELGKFYFKSLFANSEDTPPVGPYDALTHSSNYGNTTAFGELGFKLPIASKKGELLIKTYYDYSKMNYRQELLSAEVTAVINTSTNNLYPLVGPLFGLTGPATFYAPNEAQVYRTIAQHNGIGSEVNLAYNFSSKVKMITGLLYEDHRQFDVKTFSNGNIYFEYDPTHLMYIGNRNYLALEAFGQEFDITPTYNWNRNAGRQIFAAFGQAEIDLVNSFGLHKISNMLLTIGGRYDQYSDAGGRFNPRAALIFAPDEKFNFKALYGTAFRAPSFSELYTANNSFALGNPNLKPETVITGELVAEYKANKNVKIGITYFSVQVDNNIQLSDARRSGLARGYANVGKIQSQGLEASLMYSPSKRFSAFMNFTYQNVQDITKDTVASVLATTGAVVKFRQGDFHPGGIPQYMMNAGLNYAITKNIGFNISGNYLSARMRTDQMAFDVVPGGTFKTTGAIIAADSRSNINERVLLNSSIRFHSFDFARGLEMQISGYNLTNTDNYNAAYHIHKDDLRREGINWMAKISYKF